MSAILSRPQCVKAPHFNLWAAKTVQVYYGLHKDWWSLMWKKDIIMTTNFIIMMSQHHVVSNHQKLACLLTHWGRVTHICVGNLAITGSDNGLSPGRRQTIIWTSAGILLIGPLGTNFSEILIEIQTFSFEKMHLKMSSAKWRPFCPGPQCVKQLIWAKSTKQTSPLHYWSFVRGMSPLTGGFSAQRPVM